MFQKMADNQTRKKYDKVIWVCGTDHVTLSGGEMWIIKAYFKVVGFVA